MVEEVAAPHASPIIEQDDGVESLRLPYAVQCSRRFCVPFAFEPRRYSSDYATAKGAYKVPERVLDAEHASQVFVESRLHL